MSKKWITADGNGEPELPEGTMVQVKMRDGEVMNWWIGKLVENWDHSTETADDIVAYRLVDEK